jgi:adenylate cyclase
VRPLADIEACFQGVIPSYLVTSSAEGEPNVIGVSIVALLSPTRVGVSCQFLNKTRHNLEATGHAQIVALDPITLGEYRLDLEFVQLIDEGEAFDKMSVHLEAIASQTGMSGTFSLSGVAEFEVLDWRKTAPESDVAQPQPSSDDPMAQLDRISRAIETATDLDALFDQTFAVLEGELGLRHGFLLLCDGEDERLYNVASHGFDQAHFGAEIAMGEGIYGTTAARRIPTRMGSMFRERLMSRAVARESKQDDPTALPLPGLPDVESSIAVPLVRGDRCLGVLCFQSARPGAFSLACETTLTIVARQLSLMIALVAAGTQDVELSAMRGPVGSRALVTRIKYFESDGSIFVDDEYLIKGVAGRILWHVLSNYSQENRDEFSSKEIRLDPEVGLPAIKDNLEARLIALRKRLEERTTHLRVEKTGRGRFRLQVARELVLDRRP